MIRDGRQSGHYLSKGWSLVSQPGLRRFVFLPLAINFLCFGLGFWWLFVRFGEFLDWSRDQIPDWAVNLMDALSWLIWPLFVLSVLLLGSYFFGVVANWLAAPFNGLLAEAVEEHLTGQKPPPEFMHRMILRTFGREWLKLKYYLPKAIGMLLLWLMTFYIPLLNLVMPVLWFLFTAWMMGMQYLDYPMDNHQRPFPSMLQALRQKRGMVLSFGSLVALIGMVPLLNIFVMPVAVAGATAMWVEEFK
ncbi:MAG: sulfate transporter CysZ [Gammaproteobacteria bacterium]|nr:sulfate transporter CysZ [Gammaproteobacteria bacterium]